MKNIATFLLVCVLLAGCGMNATNEVKTDDMAADAPAVEAPAVDTKAVDAKVPAKAAM